MRDGEILAELRAIRHAIEGLTLPAASQRWADVATTARLFGVSESFLRKCIQDESYPPPCRRVKGKLLFDLHEMDAWLRGFPSVQLRHVALVNQLSFFLFCQKNGALERP
jgi:hypothetical protein